MKNKTRLYASSDITFVYDTSHESLTDLLVALEYERGKSYPFTFINDKKNKELIKERFFTRNQMQAVLDLILEEDKISLKKRDKIISFFDDQDRKWNKQSMDNWDKKMGKILFDT